MLSYLLLEQSLLLEYLLLLLHSMNQLALVDELASRHLLRHETHSLKARHNLLRVGVAAFSNLVKETAL